MSTNADTIFRALADRQALLAEIEQLRAALERIAAVEPHVAGMSAAGFVQIAREALKVRG